MSEETAGQVPASPRRLELLWADAAQMAVATRSIVESVNVVGDIGLCQFSVPVDLLLDSLFLQAAEEGLDDGIVPAVAFAAHARLEAVRPAESAPGVAPELGALIGVN